MTYFIHYLPPPRKRIFTFAGQVTLAAACFIFAAVVIAVFS